MTHTIVDIDNRSSAFNLWSLLIALLLVLLLIFLWMIGRGPSTVGCCAVAPVAEAPTAPLPVPTPGMEPEAPVESAGTETWRSLEQEVIIPAPGGPAADYRNER
jgi:hypothetical protein